MIKKKMIQVISVFCIGLILFSSCSSTTMINSRPDGAKLYLNGEYVGETPYRHSDTKIVGSSTDVKLEKEGYETFFGGFSRDEKADAGAIIGGLFLLFPFLWTMKYKESRTYEMIPLSGYTSPIKEDNTKNLSQSKTEKLRELKQLLDDGIITQEEFEREKKKVLEQED
ncbi:PEGA domain-containing protein [Pararhodonellum marinum]|uniref:PEGA domain-containing protein n=1 Tax=Pararhodonellum marinum TaxID=2755358 RepID=UPI00188EC13F|nr:PEGA domain-containing protein [Pararhodonellum marinum]